jgi:hypothetical protein
MKGFRSRLAHGTQSTACAMLLFPLAVLIGQNHLQAATGGLLTDGNSSIGLSLSSSAGMTNWLVNGINQVQQQWFWFRVGNNPEQDISTISAPTITQSIAKQLTVAYDLPGQYGVTVKYDLSGGSNPQLSEAVTIFNHTGGSLDFHFFQYGHVTLGNSTANQSVLFTSDLTGITSVGQTGPGGQSYQSAFTVSGNRSEAAFFNSTLTSLTDGSATTLNNNPSIGPGNVTYAVEWDLSINTGASKQISILSAIPEPSVFALGSLAMLVLLRITRKGHIKA